MNMQTGGGFRFHCQSPSFNCQALQDTLPPSNSIYDEILAVTMFPLCVCVFEYLPIVYKMCWESVEKKQKLIMGDRVEHEQEKVVLHSHAVMMCLWF